MSACTWEVTKKANPLDRLSFSRLAECGRDPVPGKRFCKRHQAMHERNVEAARRKQARRQAILKQRKEA